MISGEHTIDYGTIPETILSAADYIALAKKKQGELPPTIRACRNVASPIIFCHDHNTTVYKWLAYLRCRFEYFFIYPYTDKHYWLVLSLSWYIFNLPV